MICTHTDMTASYFWRFTYPYLVMSPWVTVSCTDYKKYAPNIYKYAEVVSYVQATIPCGNGYSLDCVLLPPPFCSCHQCLSTGDRCGWCPLTFSCHALGQDLPSQCSSGEVHALRVAHCMHTYSNSVAIALLYTGVCAVVVCATLVVIMIPGQARHCGILKRRKEYMYIHVFYCT